MSKNLKIILSIIIVLIIVGAAVFFFTRKTASSVGSANSSSTTTADTQETDGLGLATLSGSDQTAAGAGSIENAPNAPRPDETPDDEIDSYLTAHRTAEQPDPEDFDDTFSELK